MTICIFFAGFHNSAVIVNPQDLAPKHSGSVFGIMNAAGAIPGNLQKLPRQLTNIHLSADGAVFSIFFYFRPCQEFSFGNFALHICNVCQKFSPFWHNSQCYGHSS